jgi:pyruvate, orthophosphate dikinase
VLRGRRRRLQVDEANKELRVKGNTFKQGDWISLDGTTGRVIEGKLKTLPPSPTIPIWSSS